MNDERFSRRSLFSVSWTRIVLIFAILLPVFVAIYLIGTRLPGYFRLDLLQLLAWFVIAAVVLILLIETISLSNERLIRIFISAVFILILCLGVAFCTGAREILPLVPLAAASLIVFWTLNQLPAPALTILILTVCCAVFFRLVNYPSYLVHGAFFQANSPLYSSFGAICLGSLIFACVYFPRRIQWKRLLYPYRFQKKRVEDRTEKEESLNGFTLIELLIVVAIIGILTTSLLSVWAHTIRAQKNLEQRAQIAEILNSEMSALMTSSESVVPTADLQPLPIPLSEFGDGLRLKGGFTVVETEQPGLVRITVVLTQDWDSTASRHFRMVSDRCVGVKTES